MSTATLFWAILGGVLGVCILSFVLAYIVCRVRKPKGCWSSDPLEEFLQETETITREEFRTNGRGSKGPSTILIKRESLKTIRKSSLKSPGALCVGCSGSYTFPTFHGNSSSDGRHIANIWTTGSDRGKRMADVAV